MSYPKTLSLPALPENDFNRVQLTKYPDGSIVISCITKEDTKCLVTGEIARYGKAISLGLTQENSKKLREFIKC